MLDGSVLAVTLVTANVDAAGDHNVGDCGDEDCEEDVFTATVIDLVTVRPALVALIVYVVDFAGDTVLLPATSTWPIP